MVYLGMGIHKSGLTTSLTVYVGNDLTFIRPKVLSEKKKCFIVQSHCIHENRWGGGVSVMMPLCVTIQDSSNTPQTTTHIPP